MRSKGSLEAQVPERGVEDKCFLDDFCMGIELTCNDCFSTRWMPTLHESTIRR